MATPRPAGGASKRPVANKHNKQGLRQQKRKRNEDDLQSLQQRVDELNVKSSEFKDFSDLPLSTPTLEGLKAAHFTTLTDVQAQAIPLALQDKDILGAAKTGSGKTLAFLIPLLEKLYRLQWTEFDGLGALVLSPTRELAVQTFEVLRKIGRKHAFSAGLVTGGMSLKEEKQRIEKVNLLISTPGRLLQHFDQSFGFNADNLQMLVLDEADRIMDMGFQRDVDALIEHLPKSRQTLMFSATQSKKVSDLARLSLKDPEYVSVHEDASHATPSQLQQHYIVTPLHEKINTLYGFLKANLKKKLVTFLSSGKEVRFYYSALSSIQPGIQLLHLHGRQKQTARMEIISRFTSAKHACLITTPLLSRGVDIPAVDWVVQVDCPEDTDEYIHRVGRTARYQSKGSAVLFLDPSEEKGMIKKLEQRKVPINKVNIKEKKKKDITNVIQNLCFTSPDLRYLGQKAFVSYVRSIHLQRDKEIFNLDKLDLDAYAASLGLPGTPQIKFHKGEDIKKIKNASRQAMLSDSESEMEMDGTKKPKKKKDEVRTKYDRMFERTNQDVLSSHYNKLVNEDTKSDEDEDFLSVKRRLNDDDLDEEAKKAPEHQIRTVEGLGGKEPLVIDSKRREKVLKSKKKMLKFKGNPTKMVYDEDGNPHAVYELTNEDDFVQEGSAEALRRKFVEEEAQKVKEADVDDKALVKQRKREKKEKRKAREAADMAGSDFDGDEAPQLVGGDDDGHDPLEFMRSLPIAGQDGSDDDDEPPKKKAKKWFQTDDSEDEAPKSKKKSKGKGKVFEVQEEPETLADLEALATGLLDG